MENKKTFEELLKELEGLAKDLENKETPLNVAVEKYKKGIELTKELYELLDNAQKLVVEEA